MGGSVGVGRLWLCLRLCSSERNGRHTNGPRYSLSISVLRREKERDRDGTRGFEMTVAAQDQAVGNHREARLVTKYKYIRPLVLPTPVRVVVFVCRVLLVLFNLAPLSRSRSR